MALSKDKKIQLVKEATELVSGSRLTVIAEYRGTSVKAMQQLRSMAQESSTKVKIYKNRLMKKALSDVEKTKDLDTSVLSGQLMYVFNDQDEVAPAQVIAEFAKAQPHVTFVGGIDQAGSFVNAEDIKQLSSLPGKEILRGQLVGMLGSPMSGLVSVLSGNLRGLASVLDARAKSIS